MGKYFGTDGIRGVFGRDLTVEAARRIGLAAALQYPEGTRCIVCRDTRESGAELSKALSDGLCRGGINVLDAGILPTPAAARLLPRHRAQFAAVISASHNPWQYNGIKFFGVGGSKYTDEQEKAIEAFLDAPFAAPATRNGGEYTLLHQAAADYVNILRSTVQTPVAGLRVIADCANGAAVSVAKRLFEALGCHYTLLHAHPDGYNINRNCGSTHPDVLQKAMVSIGADIGLAFDGDADRCLCVDEKGSLIDGDVMMALLAADGYADGKPLVGTVMTNLGVAEFCRANGIVFEAAPVGDKNVLSRMMDCGSVLGGEQSGHVIFRNIAATGDGAQTALMMLQYLARQRRSQQGATLSQLARRVPRYPQVHRNVSANGFDKQLLLESERLKKAVTEAKTALGEDGRVLVRASGTEEIIRVLVEGKEIGPVQSVADFLASTVEDEYQQNKSPLG